MTERVCAIILAAGLGTRVGSDKTKQKIEIAGVSVLRRSLLAFDACDAVDSIVIVTRDEETEFARSSALGLNKPYIVVTGGATRAHSAARGFKVIPADTDFVAIHDAARCLIDADMIARVIADAKKHGAATAVSRVYDTVKYIDDEGYISGTLDRNSIFMATTPQVFSTDIYRSALEFSDLNDPTITDDNSLVERIGERIYLTDLGRENIKITTKDDVDYAEYLIRRKERGPMVRVGHGYDVHKLVCGRKLIIGGVDIPHTLGLDGHSDADVLIHAIMDAVLGALGRGDIGKHFPDNDDKYLGISSMKLAEEVATIMREDGYVISNIDATVIAQRPKLMPYIALMQNNIADVFGTDAGCVNVKATTEERLGFTGREEGICAHAVVLLSKK
ncbi:MAG: 2-C-methyl-D-erythritol 2,4-cyclodiphosphate synthase [Clostridia bacterium]|nr:2-C-methyl-D-erythritol 2,4-cyclodiphosphate synthase [Clostridia bacterium]